jgi:hypothetical protein
MKITTEFTGKEIGTKDSITNAMKNNDWALRVTLQADDNMSRFEFTIPMIEVDGFIDKIRQSTLELQKVREQLRNNK